MHTDKPITLSKTGFHVTYFKTIQTKNTYKQEKDLFDCIKPDIIQNKS